MDKSRFGRCLNLAPTFSIAFLLILSCTFPIVSAESNEETEVKTGVNPVMPEVTIERLASIKERGQDPDDGIDLLERGGDGNGSMAVPGDYIYMEVLVETVSGQGLIDTVDFSLEYDSRDPNAGSIGDAVTEYRIGDVESDEEWGEKTRGNYSAVFDVDNMMRFDDNGVWDAVVIVYHEDVDGVRQQISSVDFDVGSYVAVHSVDPAYGAVELGGLLEGEDFAVSRTNDSIPKVEIEANSEWKLENSPNHGWVAVGPGDPLEADAEEQGYVDVDEGEFEESLTGAPTTGEDRGVFIEIHYQLDIPLGQKGGFYRTRGVEGHRDADLARCATHLISNTEV